MVKVQRFPGQVARKERGAHGAKSVDQQALGLDPNEEIIPWTGLGGKAPGT
jgi:hypothetical protein